MERRTILRALLAFFLVWEGYAGFSFVRAFEETHHCKVLADFPGVTLTSLSALLFLARRSRRRHNLGHDRTALLPLPFPGGPMFRPRRFAFTALAAFFVISAGERTIALAGGNEAALPPSHKSGKSSSFTLGVGVKVSTLGLGIEAAVPLGRHLNLRAGFNGFDYNRKFANNGIPYDGTLRFRSVEALVDIFPFGGGFHISPGFLVYNGNQITANALVPGGNTFTLNGVPLVSSPLNPVTGTGTVLLNKTAPMIRWGFGNLVPRKSHFSFHIEGGIVFQGSPKAKLNLVGTACDPVAVLLCFNVATDPTIQSNIQAQQNKINNDLKVMKYYPAFSMGFSYRF